MRIISTKLFSILINIPLLGAIFTLIFIIPIINSKHILPENTVQGVLMQFFAPGVYLIGRTISYCTWFFFGFTTLEKIISWISFIWLLGCYAYMITGTIATIRGKRFEYKIFNFPLKIIERLLWH